MPIRLPFELNWELLKRFNICSNSKSFSEAANKIGTSPSALLHQVEQLEQELKMTLFVRGQKNRSMQLTLEGEKLKKLTEKIFKVISTEAYEWDESSANEEYKVLRIITTEGLARTVLVDPVSKYLTENENLRLELVTEANPRGIEKDEIVIRSNFLEQKNVIKKHLADYSFRLFASQEYIEKYGTPKKPDDLVNHQILAYSYLGILDTNFLWKPELNIFISPYIVSTSFNFLLEMCIKGNGIVEIADLYPISHKLIELFPSIESEKFSVHVAYNKASANNPIIMSFVDHMVKHMKERKNVK